MRLPALLLLLTSCAPTDPAPGTTAAPILCGGRCGECDAGTYDCAAGECVYPSAYVPDLVANGMPPADVGARPVFDPENMPGSDFQKVGLALLAAKDVNGAVVMSRVYEIDRALDIYPGTMLTGGGLRRTCMPAPTVTVAAAIGDTCVQVDSVAGYLPYSYAVATTTVGGGYDATLGQHGVITVEASPPRLCGSPLAFAIPVGTRMPSVMTMLRISGTYGDGVVIDSVAFDGANDCNNVTHDWRYNNTLAIRGDNVVRNSIFFDTPSENIISCGTTIEHSIGYQLQGSLAHISCASPALDTFNGNYVEQANIATDAVMGHSEGVITLSANPLPIEMSDNVFRGSAESAIGQVGQSSESLDVRGDCYANLPGPVRVHTSGAATEVTMRDVSLINAFPTVQ